MIRYDSLGIFFDIEYKIRYNRRVLFFISCFEMKVKMVLRKEVLWTIKNSNPLSRQTR